MSSTGASAVVVAVVGLLSMVKKVAIAELIIKMNLICEDLYIGDQTAAL